MINFLGYNLAKLTIQYLDLMIVQQREEGFKREDDGGGGASSVFDRNGSHCYVTSPDIAPFWNAWPLHAHSSDSVWLIE